MDESRRIRILAAGQVQGVGFRPFLWRLASSLGLTGFCRNTSAGVEIEVQGRDVERFLQKLPSELPPLAKLSGCELTELPLKAGESEFRIEDSLAGGSRAILVSPDVAVCENCLREIRDPANRRYGYPFANCTDCGPRFSITRSLPYDRMDTTMACFSLCPACAEEYGNPADRRFHAQPVACEKCGPRIWLVRKGESSLPDASNTEDALARAGEMILQGNILAIRGLGGFQLACAADHRKAVERLRMRKKRPHKALAVMSATIESAGELAQIDGHARELLTGSRKPIVLCPAHADLSMRAWLCPDTARIGLMLPYTPLHALLLNWLSAHGCSHLVMTSANRSGEPICLGNREALERLSGIADAWLLHDRDILCRVDDSVLGLSADRRTFFRRARGYVPEPIDLPAAGAPVLGCGAQLKATCCIARGNKAFLGQHIGDLENVASADFYEEAYSHLSTLLAVEPELIVHDLHPDFFSTEFAKRLADDFAVPALGLQHHVAHAAACLAENGIYDPALALCLDGTGLGTDGQIWGGELLHVNLGEPSWQRLGSLEPFRLPGGEKAILEPWRIALALRWQAGEKDFSEQESRILKLLQAGINTPLTTSAGRLFDAVSAQLGLCESISYEAQAAIRLETEALNGLPQKAVKSRHVLLQRDNLAVLDSVALFRNVCEARLAGASAQEAAWLFHFELASGFAEMAASAAVSRGIRRVALTGGVFCNDLLCDMLVEKLGHYGLEPVLHSLTPPGDGSIALGQAVWGRQTLDKRNTPV